MDLDLKFNQAVEVIDVVKKLTWMSLPLWFAITVPILYITIIKFLPNPNATASTASLAQKIINFIKPDKLNGYVLNFSIICFIVGSILVVVEKNRLESVRKNGIRLKHYCELNNFYLLRDSLVKSTLSITDNDLEAIVDDYPAEFIKLKTKYVSDSSKKDKIITTIALRDSACLKRILTNTTKLLHSYMADTANVSNFQPFNQLFTVNNAFTQQTIEKLIVDSVHKYSFAVTGANQFAIKLRKSK